VLAWLKRVAVGAARRNAMKLYQGGDWERAVTLLQLLAREQPDDANVHFRLGDTLYQLDRTREALAPLARAVRLDGGVADHHYKHGNVLKDLERVDDALAAYRRALERDPGHAAALTNIGVILEIRGNLEGAVEHYRRAVESGRGTAPAYRNLARLLTRLKRYAEAIDNYAQLMELQPDSVEDWLSYGDTCQGLGRYDESVRCYDKALALDPDLADAMRRRGLALLAAGRYAEAEAGLRRSTEIEPGHAGAWANLGDTLQFQHRYDDALRAYERGLEVEPDVPELLNNIGAAYRQKGDLAKAVHYFERAIEASPGLSSARINIANTRYSLGFLEEALAQHREVLRLDPGSMSAWRQVLMMLLYQPGLGAEEIFSQHREFATRYGRRDPPAPPERGRSGGKIRIGYVSSDLRKHPVGFNMKPIFEHHDRETFEIYVYSAAKQQDEMTRAFRGHVDGWRAITYMDDEAAAHVVRQDRLDILVVLAGRFDDNRPLLATWRLAPVQVSMHDAATSGLEEMDYLIADRNLSPRDTPERFTERVACLPTFYLHAPLTDAPPAVPPPVERNGWITFGSFNNPAKVNPAVVALWAQVLHAVAGSKLLLKYMDIFKVDEVRARYLRLFAEHGIGPERLLLPAEGPQVRSRHLARYGEIDVALDPFPFSGSTTTFEALSMGVPVVTLAGDRMVARWSASMLRKVGLSRLVARTEAEYVEIARGLAADPAGLARLRVELRERVPRSPLCAERPRVRQLERLYRAMVRSRTPLSQRS
jgi:protein O-GlcNAc transferase